MADLEQQYNDLLNDIFTVGALTAGAPLIGSASNLKDKYDLNNKIRKFGNSLIGSDYLNNQINRTLVSTTSSQVLSNSEQALQKILLSQYMALEEVSPLHVLRTLQISNILQPFSSLTNNNESVFISPNMLRNQQHYYESLIKYVNDDNKQKLKRNLEVKDLLRGMYFKNNKLYGATKSGEINLNDVVLHNARLTLSSVKNGEIYSQNHILEKFANVIGSSINNTGSKNSQIMVVGARDGLDFVS